MYIYLYKRDPEVVLNTGAKENDDAMNSFKTTAIIRIDKYSIWALSGQRRCQVKHHLKGSKQWPLDNHKHTDGQQKVYQMIQYEPGKAIRKRK